MTGSKPFLVSHAFAFMYEPFEIPVIYKGKELSFPAKLLKLGYTHKIHVDVNGQDILFEPDEERNYRAIVDPEKLGSNQIDFELLKAISQAIEAIVK